MINDSILVISDTHFPYHHRDIGDFLELVKDKYEPQVVVHNGDLTDSYAFSRYPKDAEYDEAYTVEFSTMRQCIKDLNKIFPEMVIVRSNHDDRLWDRAKEAGIPRSVILPFMSVIGADSFQWWSLVDDLVLDTSSGQWYFAHYRGANVMNVAKDAGVSVAQGHTHTKFSIQSMVGIRGRIWGVDCGCLLGADRHAFAYNKASMIRPSLGCVMIEEGIPRLIPMNVNSNGTWDGKC